MKPASWNLSVMSVRSCPGGARGKNSAAVMPLDYAGHTKEIKMKIRLRPGVLVLFALLSVAVSAVAAPGTADKKMGFFVNSVGSGKGGDLGGLSGADRHCQTLAQAVGAGQRTWHAYLSTSTAAGKPAINARERIGHGPWYNANGVLLARNV